MMTKWIERYFLIVISFVLIHFLIAGLLFGCKAQNKPNSTIEKEKEEFVITFATSPEAEGSVVAISGGKPVLSGVTKVEKNKDVKFTVTIQNPNLYELDGWEGAVKDSKNPLMAHLKVSKNAKVVARLKRINGEDPSLFLSSLKVFEKEVDISNLDDVKIEVENIVETISPSNVVAMFTYGVQNTPIKLDVSLDKTALAVGENIVKLSVPALSGSYKYFEQVVKITRKQKEKFKITFLAFPSDQGNVTATVDGYPIESGITPVEKDKVVIFTLTPKAGYTIEDWEGANKDVNNPLMASLKVSKNATVTAKLKTKVDSELTLTSLCVHHKEMDISNLSDLKMEVENFVKTINSSDIVAMFTYDDVKFPKEIIVEVDKNALDEGDTIVNLSVPALIGSYKAWGRQVKITRKPAPTLNAIPNEIKIESIEISLLAWENGKYKYGDYVPIENFNSNNAGPYTSQEAKTAYVAVRLKAEKPATVDYSIELANKTTYLKPISFLRATDDDSYFGAGMPTVLSQGYNVLEVKVKSPDNSKEGVYTIIVKYSGGPNPLAMPLEKRKMIDGIYCPVQRKPLEGEKPDFVYLISMAGYCVYCPEALYEAGDGNHIADRYKSKGLRVMAVDKDGRLHDASEAKWKATGASFPLYSRLQNSFQPIYENISGYPSRICVKEWQGTKITVMDYEGELKRIFGFN
ncbi:MAG: InlB B-repeat-containing protein [Treponema sp.]